MSRLQRKRSVRTHLLLDEEGDGWAEVEIPHFTDRVIFDRIWGGIPFLRISAVDDYWARSFPFISDLICVVRVCRLWRQLFQSRVNLRISLENKLAYWDPNTENTIDLVTDDDE
jgi:hypothetical protein